MIILTKAQSALLEICFELAYEAVNRKVISTYTDPVDYRHVKGGVAINDLHNAGLLVKIPQGFRLTPAGIDQHLQSNTTTVTPKAKTKKPTRNHQIPVQEVSTGAWI